VASPDLPGWYPLGGSGRRSSLGHDAPHTPVASWQIPAVADRSAGRALRYAKIVVLHPPKGSALAAPVTGLAAAPIAQAHAAYIALPAASAPAPATRFP